MSLKCLKKVAAINLVPKELLSGVNLKIKMSFVLKMPSEREKLGE